MKQTAIQISINNSVNNNQNGEQRMTRAEGHPKHGVGMGESQRAQFCAG